MNSGFVLGTWWICHFEYQNQTYFIDPQEKFVWWKCFVSIKFNLQWDYWISLAVLYWHPISFIPPRQKEKTSIVTFDSVLYFGRGPLMISSDQQPLKKEHISICLTNLSQCPLKSNTALHLSLNSHLCLLHFFVVNKPLRARDVKRWITAQQTIRECKKKE